jgi:ribokinase
MKVDWQNEDYVLIIGSSNMDLIIYSKKFPKPGETVTGGTFEQFLGGKGANQAVASVRSGANTIFIAKIGEDTFGDRMLKRLSGEGIDITRIIRDKKQSSGVAFIMVNDQGENMISVAPGANSYLNPKDINIYSSIITHASALVVQMELPINTISEIFHIAKDSNAIKILNPAPFKKIPKETLQNVDIIVPNEGELSQLHKLLGYSELIKEGEISLETLEIASRNISKVGIDYIITTIGPKGCVLYDTKKDVFTHFPGYEVNAIDTVGAGDCFNGVLASSLTQGKDIEEAIKYALSAASIAVTKKGAQVSLPIQSEIEKRYLEYKKLLKNIRS